MNACRLNPAWRPNPDLLAWSKTKRPDLDIADTLDQFRDYWCAKSGKDATKLDWDATWRNWVRRAYASPVKPRPVTPSPAVETTKIDQEARQANVRRFGGYLEALVGGMKPQTQDRPAKPEPKTPDAVLRAAFAGLLKP